MTLAVRAATDLGLKRSQNEDSHGAWTPEDRARRERLGTILVVADGMGGSRAGEVASRLAVETVLGVYRSQEDGDVAGTLKRAVEEANRVVHGESLTHPELRGMGTTCTAVVVRGREAWLAHVGDSRAYLVREGAIEQLTRDHSLVAQLVRDHHLTPQEARTDPRRNVVTRSVGVGPEVEVDVEALAQALRPGDTLLLCTDGLHGLVEDRELAAAASGPSLDRACDDLIALARQRGGPDNITVVLARLDPPADRPARRPSSSSERLDRARSSQRTLMLLIAALVGLLLVLAMIGWLALRVTKSSHGARAALPPASRLQEA